MNSHLASRRSVVAGVAAGATLASGIAMLAHEETPPTAPPADDALRIVAGKQTLAALPAHEMESWSRLIGRETTVTGERGTVTGTIAQIIPDRVDREVPAGVRKPAFTVRLAFDQAGAPAGNRIYPLATPVEGLSAAFLTRGDDIGGKATLFALFA